MIFCILIPSYNESRTIGHIVKRLTAKGLSVYVVDDGSKDDTAAIAESAGATVLKNDRNEGKGAALRKGFEAVAEKGYDAVLLMDGDDQHEIDDIDILVKAVADTGADMVIGNRMSDTSHMPLIRIMVNYFMSLILSLISEQHVPDSQCGFRLIKTRVLRSVKLESSNYEIESEQILKAAQAGFSIKSVPIKTVYRNEVSRIHPFFDTARFFFLLTKVLVGSIKRRRKNR